MAPSGGDRRTELQKSATERRRDRIVDYVRRFRAERGYSPSVREIQDALGISSPSVAANDLDRLADASRIRFVPGSPRTIVVVGQDIPLENK